MFSCSFCIDAPRACIPSGKTNHFERFRDKAAKQLAAEQERPASAPGV